MEDLKDKIEVMGYDILGLTDVVYSVVEAQAGASGDCGQSCQPGCSGGCVHTCKYLLFII